MRSVSSIGAGRYARKCLRHAGPLPRGMALLKSSDR